MQLNFKPHPPLQLAQNELQQSMFLTAAEVRELTDRTQPVAQVKWLRDHGIRFMVGASGRPKCMRTEVELHMLSKRKEAPKG